jgi:hypothetical protein
MIKEKNMDRKNSLLEVLNRMDGLYHPSFIDYLLNDGFLTAPASTKYHGNYEGGLFDHSWIVMDQLLQLTINEDLNWQRPESPMIVGLFHDLCKCDQYREVKPGLDLEYENAPVYEYNDKTLLKGHGDKSVMILSQFMRLTEEEVLCIRYHMGAYEKDDWDGFDRAIRKFQTVLWTHTADMIASKVIRT